MPCIRDSEALSSLVALAVVGGAPGGRGACRRGGSRSRWKRQENKPGCFFWKRRVTFATFSPTVCVRGGGAAAGGGRGGRFSSQLRRHLFVGGGGCGAVEWRQLCFLCPITGEDYDVAPLVGSLLTSLEFGVPTLIICPLIGRVWRVTL